MKTLLRVLLVMVVAAFAFTPTAVAGLVGPNCVGLVCTETITATFGPGATDFNPWAIAMPSYSVPGGDTLMGITLDLAAVDTGSLNLVNLGGSALTLGVQDNEFVIVASNSALGGADVGSFINLLMFTTGGIPGNPTQNMQIGNTGGVCPVNTPSNSCDNVTFSPLNQAGDVGVTSIPGADWASYLSGFTLGGTTSGSATLAGTGFSNANTAFTSTATLTATEVVTFDEPPPGGTPEPVSMALLGSGLACLGLLKRKRLTR